MISILRGLPFTALTNFSPIAYLQLHFPQFDNLFDDAEECPLIVPTLGDLENGLVEEETNLFPPGRIVFIHKNAPAIG